MSAVGDLGAAALAFGLKARYWATLARAAPGPMPESATGLGALPTVGAVLGAITPTLINAVVGVIAGGLAVGAVHVVKRMRGGVAAAH